MKNGCIVHVHYTDERNRLKETILFLPVLKVTMNEAIWSPPLCYINTSTNVQVLHIFQLRNVHHSLTVVQF